MFVCLCGRDVLALSFLYMKISTALEQSLAQNDVTFSSRTDSWSQIWGGGLNLSGEKACNHRQKEDVAAQCDRIIVLLRSQISRCISFNLAAF